MENVRKHRDIKLVATNRRKNYLVSEPIYHTTKWLTEFVGLRRKTYSYLIDNDNSVKKAKGIEKCVIKWRLKFNNYKNCSLGNETILTLQ